MKPYLETFPFQMKVYNGDVYFLFNKRFSSFALFHGKSDMGLYPYQTSANYRATDHASELLMQIRTLSLEQFDVAGRVDAKSYPFLFLLLYQVSILYGFMMC